MKNLVILSLISSTLFAHPSGHKVVQGKAVIESIDNVSQIKAWDKTVIHWDDFSIKKGEITQFIQPSSHAIVLNRVTGKEISKIYGTLQANGKVYLINPQGILVGETGVIDTNGFVGSTLDLVDTEFRKGESYNFKGNNNNSIVNLGTIQSIDGSIYLFGYEVKNKGIIEAKKNTVGIASVNEVLLQPKEKNKIFIKVDIKSLGSLDNSGTIDAFKTELHGLTNPYTLAISNSGKILASTLEKKDGQIFIKAHRGKLGIEGQIINEKGKITIESNDLKIGKKAKIVEKGAGKIELNLTGLHFEHSGLIKTYGGQITVRAEQAHFTHGGIIDSNGLFGGQISIFANTINNFGKTVANGMDETGGQVSFFIKNRIVENRDAFSSATGKKTGGEILYNTDYLLSSGVMNACGYDGGKITLLADNIDLPSAKLFANGLDKGGKIHINLKNAIYNLEQSTNLVKNTGTFTTNENTTIQVKGSKQQGSIYTFMTLAEDILPAQKNAKKSLLGAPVSSIQQMELVDPMVGGTNFGNGVAILDNGNIVVVKAAGSTGGSPASVGGFMLYNGTDGELISYATGVNAGDLVGLNQLKPGIIKLEGNNNFVIASPYWMNPTNSSPRAGAITFVNGTYGYNGTVNTLNSLYGTNTDDFVKNTNMVTPLTNGNYVVFASYWDSPLTNYVGAITWISGASGANALGNIGAAISTLNSVYGTALNHFYYSNYRIPLKENGNYVILSPAWINPVGVGIDHGATTWMNGASGTNSLGQVNFTIGTSNSFYGATGGDGEVLFVTPLEINGNFVISNPLWADPRLTPSDDSGAVTWIDGALGTDIKGDKWGPITSTNSIYGALPETEIGLGIAALTNGNYIILSDSWNHPSFGYDTGAATWINGASGTDVLGKSSNSVNTSNSLYGATQYARVGNTNGASEGILTNGNYIIISNVWNGVTGNGGAITWINGDNGTDNAGNIGPVSTSNSFYGTSLSDRVGGLIGYYLGGFPGEIQLNNGNFVALSPYWNGVTGHGGAATWISGDFGTDALGNYGGPVSTFNSIYGQTLNDKVGRNGGLALASPNNNGVILTPNWNNNGVAGAGAATWINGVNGRDNLGQLGTAVSTSNSLYGVTSGDKIGLDNLNPKKSLVLTNGNYVIASYNWDNGGIVDAGAATWMNGANGTDALGNSGASVSTLNSLYGTTATDKVGLGNQSAPKVYSSRPLVNGGYVIVSPNWINGGVDDAGAATCGDGSSGTIGPVSTANSVVAYEINSGDFMFAVPGISGDTFAVSFQHEGSGKVIIANCISIPPPVPPTPGPSPIPSVKEKEKALFAFYRSIADSEMGQRWNFWPGADFSKPIILYYPNETTIRILHQRAFFPLYQEKGPFKYND